MVLDLAEQHLKHVKKDVLIPKIMQQKAQERCSEQMQDVRKCALIGVAQVVGRHPAE